MKDSFITNILRTCNEGVVTKQQGKVGHDELLVSNLLSFNLV